MTRSIVSLVTVDLFGQAGAISMTAVAVFLSVMRIGIPSSAVADPRSNQGHGLSSLNVLPYIRD